MNIQKDEKGKLLLEMIKVRQPSQAPIQRFNCFDNTIKKNIWYLMQLLDYPKRMSIAVSFSFLFFSFKCSIALASSLYHSLRIHSKEKSLASS